MKLHILNNNIRNHSTSKKSDTIQILELRQEIDRIDEAILGLIARRITVVEIIGNEKKKLNLPIKNSQRERELLHRLSKQAEKLGIDQSVVKIIWKKIFRISYIMER